MICPSIYTRYGETVGGTCGPGKYQKYAKKKVDIYFIFSLKI